VNRLASQQASISLMNCALRDATPADADVIARLLTELGHPTASADVPDRMTAVLKENGRIVIADVDDSPLGLMCLARHSALHASGPIAYITALVTTSAARRKGVGRALVEEAKRWALANGCVRLSVTSAEKRTDAHAFYPSCGLPFTGRRFATSLSDTPG
jgi:GNAT superfamily N-acetyltransferase